MSYQRVNYTKENGKPSSAYYDLETKLGYDVYTREPVTLALDVNSLHPSYVEYIAPKTEENVSSETSKAKTPNREVKLKPLISAWQLIPVSLFALALWWLQTVSAH